MIFLVINICVEPCIFVDLTKAFDTVSVSKLVVKLETIVIIGVKLTLMENHLKERTQAVGIRSLEVRSILKNAMLAIEFLGAEYSAFPFSCGI